MADDALYISLRVSRALLEDAAYNYALARHLRDQLHRDLDATFDSALRSMETQLQVDRLGQTDSRY